MQVGNLIEILKKYPANYNVVFTGCYKKDGAIFGAGTSFIASEKSLCFIKHECINAVEIYNRLEKFESGYKQNEK